MRLEIMNTTDRNIVLSVDVTDKETSRMYYVFDVNLPDDLPDGEYEYRLIDGAEILSSGVMNIGGYDSDRKEYEETITYIQYESE